MAIEVRKRVDGSIAYRVVYRDMAGRKRSGGTHDNRRDAEIKDAHFKRIKQLGEMSYLERGNVSLADYAAEHYWPKHVRTLTPSTQTTYTQMWDRYVDRQLGDYTLRQLVDNPELIDDWLTDLGKAGVGDASINKVLTILQGCLTHAVSSRRISHNPARSVKRPSGERKRERFALTAEQVELLRGALIALGDVDSAVLVSTITYQFMRPSEALALQWQTIYAKRLRVAATLDGAGGLKREAKTRSSTNREIDLMQPTIDDLAWLRRLRGEPTSGLVWEASANRYRSKAGAWTRNAYKAWARRHFADGVAAANLLIERHGLGIDPLPPALTPYDLRHVGISLRIAEGWSAARVANQAGHKDSRLVLSVYSHEIQQYEGAERVPSAERVLAARAMIAKTLGL